MTQAIRQERCPWIKADLMNIQSGRESLKCKGNLLIARIAITNDGEHFLDDGVHNIPAVFHVSEGSLDQQLNQVEHGVFVKVLLHSYNIVRKKDGTLHYIIYVDSWEQLQGDLFDCSDDLLDINSVEAVKSSLQNCVMNLMGATSSDNQQILSQLHSDSENLSALLKLANEAVDSQSQQLHKSCDHSSVLISLDSSGVIVSSESSHSASPPGLCPTTCDCGTIKDTAYTSEVGQSPSTSAQSKSSCLDKPERERTAAEADMEENVSVEELLEALGQETPADVEHQILHLENPHSPDTFSGTTGGQEPQSSSKPALTVGDDLCELMLPSLEDLFIPSDQRRILSVLQGWSSDNSTQDLLQLPEFQLLSSSLSSDTLSSEGIFSRPTMREHKNYSTSVLEAASVSELGDRRENREQNSKNNEPQNRSSDSNVTCDRQSSNEKNGSDSLFSDLSSSGDNRLNGKHIQEEENYLSSSGTQESDNILLKQSRPGCDEGCDEGCDKTEKPVACLMSTVDFPSSKIVNVNCESRLKLSDKLGCEILDRRSVQSCGQPGSSGRGTDMCDARQTLDRETDLTHSGLSEITAKQSNDILPFMIDLSSSDDIYLISGQEAGIVSESLVESTDSLTTISSNPYDTSTQIEPHPAAAHSFEQRMNSEANHDRKASGINFCDLTSSGKKDHTDSSTCQSSSELSASLNLNPGIERGQTPENPVHDYLETSNTGSSLSSHEKGQLHNQRQQTITETGVKKCLGNIASADTEGRDIVITHKSHFQGMLDRSGLSQSPQSRWSNPSFLSKEAVPLSPAAPHLCTLESQFKKVKVLLYDIVKGKKNTCVSPSHDLESQLKRGKVKVCDIERDGKSTQTTPSHDLESHLKQGTVKVCDIERDGKSTQTTPSHKLESHLKQGKVKVCDIERDGKSTQTTPSHKLESQLKQTRVFDILKDRKNMKIFPSCDLESQLKQVEVRLFDIMKDRKNTKIFPYCSLEPQLKQAEVRTSSIMKGRKRSLPCLTQSDVSELTSSDSAHHSLSKGIRVSLTLSDRGERTYLTSSGRGGRIHLTSSDRAGRNLTSPDKGGRNLISPDRGGRNLTSPDKGGRNLISLDRGGRACLTSPDRGGRNLISPDRGGRACLTSPDRGGRTHLTSPDRGGRTHLTSPDRGGRNLISPDRGGRACLTSPDRGGRTHLTSPDRGGRTHLTSPDRGARNLTSSDRAGRNLTSPCRDARNLKLSDRGGNLTSSDRGGRNVTSSHRDGRNLTSSDSGGRNLTSDRGGRNLTSSNRGGRNLTSSARGGRTHLTSYKGGRNLTSSDRGGRNLTSSDRGGRNLTSSDRGGRNLISSGRGGRNLTSSDRGGRNLTSSNRGGRNLTSSNRGGRTHLTSYKGGRNLTSSDRGGRNLTSSDRGGRNLTSSDRGGRNLISSGRGGRAQLKSPDRDGRTRLTSLDRGGRTRLTSPDRGEKTHLTSPDRGGRIQLTSPNRYRRAHLTSPDRGGRIQLTSPNRYRRAHLTSPDKGGRTSLTTADRGGRKSLTSADSSGRTHLTSPDRGGRNCLASHDRNGRTPLTLHNRSIRFNSASSDKTGNAHLTSLDKDEKPEANKNQKCYKRNASLPQSHKTDHFSDEPVTRKRHSTYICEDTSSGWCILEIKKLAPNTRSKPSSRHKCKSSESNVSSKVDFTEIKETSRRLLNKIQNQTHYISPCTSVSKRPEITKLISDVTYKRSSENSTAKIHSTRIISCEHDSFETSTEARNIFTFGIDQNQSSVSPPDLTVVLSESSVCSETVLNGNAELEVLDNKERNSELAEDQPTNPAANRSQGFIPSVSVDEERVDPFQPSSGFEPQLNDTDFMSSETDDNLQIPSKMQQSVASLIDYVCTGKIL